MQANKNMWYLDNDANYHIYGDIDKFRELDESIKGNVTFVDHSNQRKRHNSHKIEK
jgi:hypothetical protein